MIESVTTDPTKVRAGQDFKIKVKVTDYNTTTDEGEDLSIQNTKENGKMKFELCGQTQQTVIPADPGTTIEGTGEITATDVDSSKVHYLIPKGNTKQAIIPNEYQQVEYIESTGSQYIDTRYKLTSNNLQINTKIYTANMPSVEQDIVSNQDNTNGRFILGLYNKRVFLYNKNENVSYNNAYSSVFDGSQTLEIQANISGTIKKINVNGTDFAITINDYNIYSSNNNIILFSDTNNANKFIGKLYYLKLYDNNVLVRDYIPCYRKSDSVVGLYDIVNGSFYTYGGENPFLKGSDIPNPNYPQKIKNVKGKNLFDKNNVIENEYYATTGNITSNNSYCRNDEYIYCYGQTKIAISGASIAGNGNLIYYDKDKNFVDYWGVRNRTIDIPTNVYYIRISTHKDYINTLQVEFNSVATEYVPGNCVQIKAQNKNLFDLKTFLTTRSVPYIENEDGSITFTTSSSLYLNPLEFSEEDEIISLSGLLTTSEEMTNSKIEILDSNNSVVGNLNLNTSKIENISGCKLRFNMTSNKVINLKNVQLELGSTATDYVEHQEQIVNFPLSEGQYLAEGGYLADDGIHNIYGQAIFDGTEDWNVNETSGIYRFYKSVDFNYKHELNISSGWSNYFIAQNISNQGTDYNIDNSFNFGESSNNYIRFRTSTISTVPNWKAWLSTHNVLVQYPLATETITPYTTEQQEAWDQIKALSLYNDITYVSFNGNIEGKLKLQYNVVLPSPTPDVPSQVHTVSGENTIIVSNEDDSQSQNTIVDLGSVELCKIGEYQDYIYRENGVWYKKAYIGKIVFDGSSDENWNRTVANNIARFDITGIDFKKGTATSIIATFLSNYFLAKNFNDLVSGNVGVSWWWNNNTKAIVVCMGDDKSVSDFKTWLSTHNTAVYYLLESPLTTEITDTNLIEQLEALRLSTTYANETNIAQSNNDLPFWLKVMVEVEA